MRIRPIFTILLGALVATTLAATPASSGDDCASARAANSLLGCEHCQTMKKLFGDDAVARLRIEVHDFDRGVLVEVHAGRPSDMAYVSSFVDELWVRSDHSDRNLSQSCESRYSNLDRVRVEKASTEDGVFLILSSDDEETVRWLQDDAKSTKSYVLAAAKN